MYRAYAARLVARLPKAPAGAGAVPALGTTDWQVRLSEEDIDVVCLIIGTAQHCQEMVRQLARALAAKLVPPELASRWGAAAGRAGSDASEGGSGGRWNRVLSVVCSCWLWSALSFSELPSQQQHRPPPPPLSPRVDMSEEEDEFQTVITHCLTALLLGIETRLEAGLAAMARINWAGMEMVRGVLSRGGCGGDGMTRDGG